MTEVSPRDGAFLRTLGAYAAQIGFSLPSIGGKNNVRNLQ